jgi:hypothetical protein
MPTTEEALRSRLAAVPLGLPGWKQFEDAATDALRHLFVPPLAAPITHTGAACCTSWTPG